MVLEGIVLATILGGQLQKSSRLDEEATRKNSKAFTRAADAQYKLEHCQAALIDALTVNAKRKNALLTCHLKLFQEQYSVIRNIQFKRGRGIQELEELDAVKQGVIQYVSSPAVASGMVMRDSQLLFTVALMGIGGLSIQSSKANLKTATQNLSMANAMVAQADSICTALEGIRTHVEIITKLLESLGLLYWQSIKRIENILNTNGLDSDNYSDDDIDAINVSLDMTKIVYRIINIPMIDNEGQIEMESLKVIAEGQSLLNKIQQI